MRVSGTASGDSGRQGVFADWSGASTSESSSLIIAMEADTELVATFEAASIECSVYGEAYWYLDTRYFHIKMIAKNEGNVPVYISSYLADFAMYVWYCFWSASSAYTTPILWTILASPALRV